MKKIFTFLVAFLATMSGAVWGQEPDYEVLKSGNIARVDGDGRYYFTTNGQQIENGGIIVTDDSPKIHLKGVNIKAGGSAIIIENGANPTIIVEGENTIMSSSDPTPAIRVGDVYGSATDVSLTIEGTGILKIEMSDDNGIAIGNCQLGGAMGPCGSVTINSSTVQTNGRIGHFTGHAFRFGGNAIVIANDIEGFDHNDKDMRRGGLLFLNDDTPYVGEFHTPEQDPEFTLSSPLPEPYKIEVRSGGVEVTIGEGQSLAESQVDLQGGTLNAYKVVYDMNKPANLTDVNPATVPSIYCGANTPLATIDPTLNPVDTYHYFGWANGNNITTQTDGDTPNQVEEVNAKAVWVVASKKVTTEKGSAIAEFSLVYPENVTGINISLAESSILPDALMNSSNKISGTLNASGTTKYTASYGEKSETVTLTFEATETKFDLEEEGAFVLQVKDLTYNGMVQKPSVQVLDVVEGRNLDLNANYTVSYEPSEVKDAQQYTVTVTGIGAYEGTLTETFNVNKADAKVTAADVEWTIGEDEGPDFSKALSATGVGEDKLTATYTSTDPTSWTEPGIYNVTYKGIKLNKGLAGNYNEVADVTGKLTVKKTGGEDDPIDPNPDDGDEDEDPIIKPGDDEGNTDGWTWDATANQWKRFYDGKAHPFTKITVTYTDETAEGETKTKTETLTVGEGGNADVTVSYSSDEDGTASVTEIKNAATYYAHITINKEGVISGKVEPVKLFIDKRPMIVTINPLTAEDLEKTTVNTDMVDFEDEGDDRGLVTDEPAGVSGKMKVTENTASSVEEEKSYTVEFSELKLMDSGDKTSFLADNYTPTFKYGDTELKDGAGTIPDVTIDEITPGEDTDIDDGNDDEDNNWTWDAEANAYILIYDGNEHGIESITVSGAEATEIKVTYSDEEGVELGKDELPLDAGHYTAEVIVTVEGTSKTGTIPLWIKQRPLGVHFNLNDYILEAGGEYDAIDVAEYEPVEVEENVWVGGELKSEEPVLEGKIKVADTPNSEDKYAVTFEGVKLGTEGNFDADNYEPTYYLNGELIELDENGNGTSGGDDDPEQGIDISEPDDETGISGIGTKRYRLYLANKDYNVVDAKADYAAEGLELFSRHDKKYTKVGGSFTVWYEKDGVANAGGYRIFWSNRANGDYKEVKFDTVSEYFQIRNVQSDVYVKIYAADGFPVGNEEISAADYRAYAQPNKIVVITPQPTDVQIISMAGAVVATDKVTGQREFANLAEGVYIVRMGETVVKLQVRK